MVSALGVLIDVFARFAGLGPLALDEALAKLVVLAAGLNVVEDTDPA